MHSQTADRFRFSICALTIAATLGCGTNASRPNIELVPVSSPLRDENGKFTLVVSNQCLSEPWLDAKIEIDGDVVVHDLFHIGKNDRVQHTGQRYTLRLEPGDHRLRVTSRLNRSELQKEFHVGEKSWGAYMALGCRSTGFHVLDQPFGWK